MYITIYISIIIIIIIIIIITHILRVLKRGGVPLVDLLKVYFALIRSVLEYCCPVWHNALPVKLSAD